jgi:hypothetical protein
MGRGVSSLQAQSQTHSGRSIVSRTMRKKASLGTLGGVKDRGKEWVKIFTLQEQVEEARCGDRDP